jgi:pyruvate formate lyase activating enzyme
VGDSAPSGDRCSAVDVSTRPDLSGIVFNIQRFSLHDGPGIRTTVFLKGCALSCAWCHNPESRSPRPETIRLANRCIRCGRCSEDELADPVVRGRGVDDVDRCPSGALMTVGETFEVGALVEIVARDRVFFNESGGGVTFSGGEPLMQAAFVTEAMRLLRDDGIRTALDTCGYARWTDLRAAAAQADLVLYDLKLMDPRRHRKATGISNEKILQNLVALSEEHDNIRIRIPVIPGWNDDDPNIEAAAAFVASLPGVRHLELLPYHPTGAAKFPRVGLTYELHKTPRPADEHMERLAGMFRARGLSATVGGAA